MFEITTDPVTSDVTTLDQTVAMVTEGVSPQDDLGSIYYEISEKLFIYFDPVLTFVGIVGNVLMLLTVQRKNLRSSPMSVFISALAVADTLVLALDFINNWPKMALKVNILGYSEAFCKFHRMFFTSCFTYAAWAVVAVSVERFIVVWFPLRAKVICTRKNAILTVTLLYLPIGVLHLFNFWTWEHDERDECNVTPEHHVFMTYFLPWINAALYSYIPSLTLIVVNAAIIVRLARHSRSRGEMTTNEKRDKKEKNEARITRTVIAICAAYLLLTLPLAVFYIVQFAAGEFIHQGPQMALAEVIILVLALANHASNFFLYVITSRAFRAEMLDLVTCGRRQAGRGETSMHTAQTNDTATTSTKF